MPFTWNWYDTEETLLEIQVIGNATWEEFHELQDFMAEKVKAAPGRLDIICEIKGNHMPKGNPMPHLHANARRMKAMEPKGVMMLVNNQPSASYLMTVMTVVMKTLRINPDPTRGQMVSSRDKALKWIMDKRTQEGVPLPKPTRSIDALLEGHMTNPS